MAKGKAHVAGETFQQHFDGRSRLFAVRTLEIAVPGHHDRGVIGPQDVIHVTDRLYETWMRGMIHVPLLLIHFPCKNARTIVVVANGFSSMIQGVPRLAIHRVTGSASTGTV